MSATALGRVEWSMDRADTGHRTYKLKTKVKATDGLADGPYTILNASGLPLVGSTWNFGGDVDVWAYCSPVARVSRHRGYEEGPGKIWYVEQTFSTDIYGDSTCADTEIGDPTLRPPRLSGTFGRFMKKATKDRNGDLIKSSSHEPLVGIEQQIGRPTVNIEYSTYSNQFLNTLSQMTDTVNGTPQWGLGTRKIMLSDFTWVKNIQGTCTAYYTITLNFEIRFEGFDIDDAVDSGFKVLKSGGNKDVIDDFERYEDYKGNPSPTRVLLDGNGALGDPTAPTYVPNIELYSETNFFTLGIPAQV